MISTLQFTPIRMPLIRPRLKLCPITSLRRVYVVSVLHTPACPHPPVHAPAAAGLARLRKVQTRCGYPAASFRGRVELYGVTRHGTGTARSHGDGWSRSDERAQEARMTIRNGSAEWHGNVESGSGTVTVGDGVFEGAYSYDSRFGAGHRKVESGSGTVTVGDGVFEGPYSYDSRFGEGKGTNPEQLIAAAHASCFTMALSNILSAAGHPPQSLRTNARVQLRNIDGAPTLTRINLDTEGRVTGVDEQ